MSKINKIVKSNKINLKEQTRQLLPGLLGMVAEEIIGITIEKKISVKQIEPNPWNFLRGRVSITEDTSVRYILDTGLEECSANNNCSRE